MIELFINKRKKITIELLYEKFENVLYNAAYAILQKQDLAENAVNDTMVEAIKHFEKLNGLSDEQIKSYLIVVCSNKAKDIYKSFLKSDFYSVEILDQFQDSINVEEEAEVILRNKKINELIELLDAKYKQVILLRFYENKPIHDISMELNISQFAVKKRITRAKLVLKELLLKEGITYE